MDKYTVVIYDGGRDRDAETPINQILFRFEKDDVDAMSSFILMALEHNAKPINVQIIS